MQEEQKEVLLTQISESIGEPVPTEQWGLICPSEGKLQIAKIPVEKPKYGQVLIKCFAAPINPSDIGMMKGYYSEHKLFKIHYPTTSGWEAAGIVVAYGGYQVMGRALMGKRVAFTRVVTDNMEMISGGCYQQYVIGDVMKCVPIPANIPMQLGSMHFVNPITAVGLVESISKFGSKAAVQTAACSQLGRMIIKLCQEKKIPLINIVRRDEQVRILKEEFGCQYVLNSSHENFWEELKNLAKEVKATVLLECIGGDTTPKLLESMPSRTTCVFYGSMRECALEGFDPLVCIGRNYAIEGFILDRYVKSKGLLGLLPVMRKVMNMMGDQTLHSKIQGEITFTGFRKGIEDYLKNMTSGKYILCPNEFDEALEGASPDSEIFQEFDIKDLVSAE